MSIIIADSSDVMRAGLISVLKKDAAFSVVGEATNREQLEEQIKLYNPSIVIIDYTSKGFSVDVIKTVVDKFLVQLQLQLDDKKVFIEVDEDARLWLVKNGYDSKMGARPMDRLIQEKIKKPNHY